MATNPRSAAKPNSLELRKWRRLHGSRRSWLRCLRRGLCGYRFGRHQRRGPV